MGGSTGHRPGICSPRRGLRPQQCLVPGISTSAVEQSLRPCQRHALLKTQPKTKQTSHLPSPGWKAWRKGVYLGNQKTWFLHLVATDR